MKPKIELDQIFQATIDHRLPTALAGAVMDSIFHIVMLEGYLRDKKDVPEHEKFLYTEGIAETTEALMSVLNDQDMKRINRWKQDALHGYERRTKAFREIHKWAENVVEKAPVL